MTDTKVIADRLKLSRKSMGLTMSQLAEKMGVAQSAIVRWENGTTTPKNDKLEKLAEILGVSVAYLMGFTKFKSESESLNEAMETGDILTSLLGFNHDTEYKKSSDELYWLTQDIYEESYNLTIEERGKFEAIVYIFLLMSDSERDNVIKYSEFLLSKKGYIIREQEDSGS